MGNIGRKDGSTPESLINFIITTCYSRIASSDLVKLENLRQSLKHMLSMERKSHPGKDSVYDELDQLLDKFFEYLRKPKLLEDISKGKISRSELEEKVLAEVANIPKRKYDMSDLYSKGLIASSKTAQNEGKVVLSGKKGITYEYYDKDDRFVSITDVGKVSYQEWNGMKSDLSVYLIQKQNEDGTLSQNLACTNIIIPMMDNSKYREAVLDELLSDDNIKKSNAGSYLGKIERRRKADAYDVPHSERQSVNEYSYRIDDEYVLVYDATELSAVIEAIRKYGPRMKAKLNTSAEGPNKNDGQTRRNRTDPDDYDEPAGR